MQEHGREVHSGPRNLHLQAKLPHLLVWK